MIAIFCKVDLAVNNLDSFRFKPTLLFSDSAKHERRRKSAILVHNLVARILRSIRISVQSITNRTSISYAPHRNCNLPICHHRAAWYREQQFQNLFCE